ncbi:MAG: PKD domain-containing protein [Patescibacteria group bacterium]
MKKLIAVLGILGVLAFAVPAFAQYAPTYPYPAPVPAYGCPQLTYNLYRGLSDYYTGGQVTQLQQFFASRSYYQPVTGYFGIQTQANVAQFQREQGVYPVTGGVGPLTRAAIVRVCGGIVYPPPTYGTISITNISGPNSVTVGQQATWSITTSAPYGSYLSTSVRWGDENMYGYPYGMAAASNISQQTSFNHSYSQAGMYTITFTVTDSAGRTASANTTVVVSGTQSTNVTFSASPTSGLAPLAVAFSVNTVTGYDIGGFSIDFGDGQTGNPQTIYCFAAPCNPAMAASHTYTSNGTYTAKLMYQPSFYCPPGAMCPMMMPAPQVVGTATITAITGWL